MPLDRGTSGRDPVRRRKRRLAPSPPLVRGEDPADKAYAPRTTAPTIDVSTRPPVRNRNGSVSTVKSMGITDERGREVLIPMVVDGRVLPDTPEGHRQAVEHYYETGEHLGVYPTRAASDRAGRQLHEQEARRVRELERRQRRE